MQAGAFLGNALKDRAYAGMEDSGAGRLFRAEAEPSQPALTGPRIRTVLGPRTVPVICHQ